MMESAAHPSLPRRLANLVRLEHSLFALPYALVGALLAADGLPPLLELLIRYGCDVNAQNRQGQVCVSQCCYP